MDNMFPEEYFMIVHEMSRLFTSDTAELSPQEKAYQSLKDEFLLAVKRSNSPEEITAFMHNIKDKKRFIETIGLDVFDIVATNGGVTETKLLLEALPIPVEYIQCINYELGKNGTTIPDRHIRHMLAQHIKELKEKEVERPNAARMISRKNIPLPQPSPSGFPNPGSPD